MSHASRFKTREHTDQDMRLQQLEEQISQLLSKNKGEVEFPSSSDDQLKISSQDRGILTKQAAERDVDPGDLNRNLHSGSDTDKERKDSRRHRKSRLPSYRKSTAASRARKENRNSVHRVGGVYNGEIQPVRLAVSVYSSRDDGLDTSLDLILLPQLTIITLAAHFLNVYSKSLKVLEEGLSQSFAGGRLALSKPNELLPETCFLCIVNRRQRAICSIMAASVALSAINSKQNDCTDVGWSDFPSKISLYGATSN
ncbi:hypothetical protein DPMN_174547 [Dreissena polymorpha]|uniref:Uncharacterized protein n=1 Tax=Dreissena polymorpha TaxID=45954 RepID=A0A9D4E7B6_DREPO|nr:hypothetical protein DPMN_174547 [Dreissena polymorpha]